MSISKLVHSVEYSSGEQEPLCSRIVVQADQGLADDILKYVVCFFPRKMILTFHADCLQWRQFTGKVKSRFLGKNKIYHNFLSAELAFRVVKDEIRQTEADVRHMKIVKAFFSLHLFILVYMSDQSLYHTLNKA